MLRHFLNQTEALRSKLRCGHHSVRHTHILPYGHLTTSVRVRASIRMYTIRNRATTGIDRNILAIGTSQAFKLSFFNVPALVDDSNKFRLDDPLVGRNQGQPMHPRRCDDGSVHRVAQGIAHAGYLDCDFE